MGLIRRVATLLAVPSLGLGIALALLPRRTELEIHVWLLVALSLVLLSCLGALRSTYPTAPASFPARAARPPAAHDRPVGLVRLERELSMARSAAFDVHYRLRPTVQHLAAALLVSRHGIDFEREPERARAVLADEVWELVRPDRPQPVNRLARGIGAAELERVVSGLEHI